MTPCYYCRDTEEMFAASSTFCRLMSCLYLLLISQPTSAACLPLSKQPRYWKQNILIFSEKHSNFPVRNVSPATGSTPQQLTSRLFLNNIITSGQSLGWGEGHHNRVPSEGATPCCQWHSSSNGIFNNKVTTASQKKMTPPPESKGKCSRWHKKVGKDILHNIWEVIKFPKHIYYFALSKVFTWGTCLGCKSVTVPRIQIKINNLHVEHVQITLPKLCTGLNL